MRIPDAGVSREHCELVIDEDSVTVRDLDSSNGTFVNATRVKEAELAPGDLLAIGSIVFAVRIDGFPKLIDPASAYLEGTPPPPAPISPVRAVPKPGPPGAKADNEGSSVMEFDFLDEGEVEASVRRRHLGYSTQNHRRRVCWYSGRRCHC